jgi:hypothetical protein
MPIPENVFQEGVRISVKFNYIENVEVYVWEGAQIKYIWPIGMDWETGLRSEPPPATID